MNLLLKNPKQREKNQTVLVLATRIGGQDETSSAWERKEWAIIPKRTEPVTDGNRLDFKKHLSAHVPDRDHLEGMV